MPKPIPPVKIESVLFIGTGTDADFDEFLRTVFFDYLHDKQACPQIKQEDV